MTPMERLQAAIDLLEQQRSAADHVRSDSQWVVDYELAEGMGLIHVLDSHNGGHDGSIVATATSEARAADRFSASHDRRAARNHAGRRGAWGGRGRRRRDRAVRVVS